MTEPRNFFDELSQCITDYPELVFNNNGYEQLPHDVIERNRQGIDKIEEILRVSVEDFIRFQNFKPRNDGSIDIRCQTQWSDHFQGVSYFPLENFKPDHPSWKEGLVD